MTVDSTGRLWTALWDGSAVHCYAPDGSLDEVVAVPARRPTSVCLAEGKLYVTTAANGLSDPGRAEGAVLSVTIDADAPPASPFRGAF
jgi:sugar lactone lactonase YvrE